jgi:hypothetical protein
MLKQFIVDLEDVDWIDVGVVLGEFSNINEVLKEWVAKVETLFVFECLTHLIGIFHRGLDLRNNVCVNVTKSTIYCVCWVLISWILYL